MVADRLHHQERGRRRWLRVARRRMVKTGAGRSGRRTVGVGGAPRAARAPIEVQRVLEGRRRTATVVPDQTQKVDAVPVDVADDVDVLVVLGLRWLHGMVAELLLVDGRRRRRRRLADGHEQRSNGGGLLGEN